MFYISAIGTSIYFKSYTSNFFIISFDFFLYRL